MHCFKQQKFEETPMWRCNNTSPVIMDFLPPEFNEFNMTCRSYQAINIWNRQSCNSTFMCPNGQGIVLLHIPKLQRLQNLVRKSSRLSPYRLRWNSHHLGGYKLVRAFIFLSSAKLQDKRTISLCFDVKCFKLLSTN